MGFSSLDGPSVVIFKATLKWLHFNTAYVLNPMFLLHFYWLGYLKLSLQLNPLPAAGAV